MTKISPATAARWAVSIRMNGEVLTAAVSLPGIELCLLGIPQGFTPLEIQSWLRDLAGVAIETSRSDPRPRPIPQLLHHVLTGLLFSQTELWGHTGQSVPCAAVFVNGPSGVAFGWVGGARVLLLVNGEPYEPQWVIVRDDAGHEAMSAMLPSEVHAMLTLDYRPLGKDGPQAPAAVDAEWGQAARDEVVPVIASAPPADAAAPGSPAARPHSPEVPLAAARAPAPESLPTQQPGIAPDPASRALDEPDVTQQLPSTRHPSAGTFAMPALPGRGAENPAAPPAPASPTAGPAAAGLVAHTVMPSLADLASAVSAMPAQAAGSVPAAAAPPAVWSPSSSGVFLPEPDRDHPTVAPLASAAPDVAPQLERTTPGVPSAPADRPLPPTRREPREQEGAGGHPVGRWLSRLMGLGRKPAPPAAELPPLSTYDAILRSPAAPVYEPSPAREHLPLASAHADIEEPHALPVAGPPAPPTTPAPVPRKGLSAAGAEEILGVLTGSRIRPEVPSAGDVPGVLTGSRIDRPLLPVIEPVEGLTAVSSASGPIDPAFSTLSSHESRSPGAPPYPMLDVPATTPDPRAPMHIDREPIGADESFAIPKLSSAQSALSQRLASPVVPAAPGTAAPQAPTPSQVPPQVAPQAPSAPTAPPVLQSPGARPAAAQVPEPPADFLAEFAASMRVEPALDPTPARPAPPDAARAVGPPIFRIGPLLPSAPGGATPAAAGPVAPQAHVPQPLVPPAVAPPAPAPVPAAAAVPAPPVPVAPAAPPAAAPAVPGAPVLRTPTTTEPVPFVAAAQAELMRELPLPTPSAELMRPAIPAPPDDEVPDGMLVAQAATPMPPGSRSRLAAWPAPEELETGATPLWKKPWAIAAFITVLFGVGWFVGHAQTADNDVHATPMSRVLRVVGLGGARFSASIDSDPPGAWIAIDGKDVARRTPSTVELSPGAHTVTLSMPDLGSVKVTVDGTRGQKKQINEALHGSLEVTALDPELPVKMSLDGKPQGWLPVNVAKLPPGMHEVQFSGPNMQTWGQTVNIPIRQNTQLVARPMMSPATGVVQVQASVNDDNGTAPLSGASVWVDGELRGTTPITLELPRGPHSLRVVYRDETAPVQVIDLPGGNKRFAAFQFGLDSDLPPLRLQGNYAVVPSRKVITVTATLDGLDVKDVREAWLHARAPEGLWRRYEMTLAGGPRGAVLSAVFPGSMFDGQSRVLWYLSAATAQGDEFYTEMQRSGR